MCVATRPWSLQHTETRTEMQVRIELSHVRKAVQQTRFETRPGAAEKGVAPPDHTGKQIFLQIVANERNLLGREFGLSQGCTRLAPPLGRGTPNSVVRHMQE